jgi:predicted outer membrane repeat protein
MATIAKHVDSAQGNDANTGAANQPWKTIQHGVDWWLNQRTPGDDFDLRLTGEFHENVRMLGPGYSDITIESATVGPSEGSGIPEFCQARVPCGGYPPPLPPALGLSGTVFTIRDAQHVTLKNLTILSANQGVLAVKANSLTLDHCCIHDNNDTTEDGSGFHISASRNVTVNQCSIWSNSAKNGGGGYLNECTGATIIDTFFSQNDALHQGGALAIYKCRDVKIAGCTIGAPSNPAAMEGPNHAKNGGGVWICDSTEVVFAGSGSIPLPAPPPPVAAPNPTVIGSNTADNNGGGIYVERIYEACDVTLQDGTEVASNQAAGNGGGIALDGADNTVNVSTLKLDHASVHDNQAPVRGRTQGEGGGIWARRAICSIQDSTVSANTAYLEGGGIFSYYNLKVTGGSIKANHGFYGGGIYVDKTLAAALSMEDVQIEGNIAFEGGGIRHYAGTTELTRVTLINNESTDVDGAGGGLSATGSVILRDCIFGGNKACNSGGAAYIADYVNIEGCQFAANSAWEDPDGAGGALFLSGVNGEVKTSQFAQNNAFKAGGAICVAGADFDFFKIAGNFFSVNAAPDGADIFAKGSPNVSATKLTSENIFQPGPPGIKV